VFDNVGEELLANGIDPVQDEEAHGDDGISIPCFPSMKLRSSSQYVGRSEMSESTKELYYIEGGLLRTSARIALLWSFLP